MWKYNDDMASTAPGIRNLVEAVKRPGRAKWVVVMMAPDDRRRYGTCHYHWPSAEDEQNWNVWRCGSLANSGTPWVRKTGCGESCYPENRISAWVRYQPWRQSTINVLFMVTSWSHQWKHLLRVFPVSRFAELYYGADFEPARHYVRKIVSSLLQNGQSTSSAERKHPLLFPMERNEGNIKRFASGGM